MDRGATILGIVSDHVLWALPPPPGGGIPNTNCRGTCHFCHQAMPVAYPTFCPHPLPRILLGWLALSELALIYAACYAG